MSDYGPHVESHVESSSRRTVCVLGPMLRIGKADTLVLGLIDGARVEDLGLFMPHDSKLCGRFQSGFRPGCEAGRQGGRKRDKDKERERERKREREREREKERARDSERAGERENLEREHAFLLLTRLQSAT